MHNALPPTHTHTHTYTHSRVCVCVCVFSWHPHTHTHTTLWSFYLNNTNTHTFHLQIWEDGWVVRGGLPKRWAPGQRERGTKQPPCWLPGDPIIQREGGQGHTHMHINMRTHTHTHNTYSLTHTHTNPAGLKWAQHFDIDLFFLSLPHPPNFSSLTPHPLLDSPSAHHRASAEEEEEEEEEGREGKGGGIFGKMERKRGGRKGGGGTITWQLTMECLALIPSVLACTQISSCQNQYES